MTRTLPTARKPAAPMLVALVAVLACVLSPAVASADVEIPLDTAISPQYHGVDLAAAVDSATAAIPAEPPAPPAPPPAPAAPPPAPDPQPPAPAPEPEYHPEIAPQYHSEAAPNKSENQAPAEPAREQPAPDPPRVEKAELPEDAAAAAKDPGPAVEIPDVAEAPQPTDELAREHHAAGALGDAGEMTGAAGSQPDLDNLLSALSGTTGAPGDVDDRPPVIAGVADALPDVDDALPRLGPEIPKSAGPVPVPPVPAVGNLNVSLRIFSPGDDGPVTQIVSGGGGSSAVAPIAAPTTWTWIWNWTWTGAGCDAGMPGTTAPDLGISGWNWNWNWSCGAGAPKAPGAGRPITLPNIDAIVDSLTSIDSLPSLGGVVIADLPPITIPKLPGAKPAKPAAGAPESRAGRERPGGSSLPASRGGPAAWARSPSAIALAPAAVAAVRPAAAERPETRRAARDTTRKRRAIPAEKGPAGVPMAAAAAAPAAAGSGGGPAALTMLILIFMSFLAGALLAGVGLPRLQPRSSRLERPG
jgi:outer membrane biosynthesis protein TonB